MTEALEVVARYSGVKELLDTPCANGCRVGDCKHGVYLFYDYDSEPIYVGQTSEMLRVRIRRHLTNQRTDAVAMSVLDPLEVAEVGMWPFWDFGDADPGAILDAAEFTVFKMALERSRFDAILNEYPITGDHEIALPESVRRSILPAAERAALEYPDVRLARRAQTIASLARIISERRVKLGLPKLVASKDLRRNGCATWKSDPIAPSRSPLSSALIRRSVRPNSASAAARGTSISGPPDASSAAISRQRTRLPSRQYRVQTPPRSRIKRYRFAASASVKPCKGSAASGWRNTWSRALPSMMSSAARARMRSACRSQVFDSRAGTAPS